MNAVDACIFLNGRKLMHRALFARERMSVENRHCVTLNYHSAAFSGASIVHQKVSADPNPLLITGYADGGAEQPLAAAFESKPLNEIAAETLWVGDMDSLKKIPQGARTVTLDRQKSVSDGAALMDMIAVRMGKSAPGTLSVIEIVGATGGRRDHEWANLAEIQNVFRALPAVVIILQPSIILFGPAVQLTIEGYPKGWPLSCFASDPDHELVLEGLEYSGKYCMRRPSTGLSNVSLGNTITVKSEAASAIGLAVGWSYLVLGHDEECYFLTDQH
jgi:thiamine pyrophosphokinase